MRNQLGNKVIFETVLTFKIVHVPRDFGVRHHDDHRRGASFGDHPIRDPLHLAELHKSAEASAETLWLAVRIERKLGDREAESRFSSQMRRKFPAAPETQRLMQGLYE